jgi:hypothetical protein
MAATLDLLRDKTKMKITHINLPKTECYPCSRRNVKDVFTAGCLDSASFGWTTKKHEFDDRCHRRPKLKGQIIASVTFNRNRKASIRLFAVKREEYPKEKGRYFIEEVLSRLERWLTKQEAKPETAIVGVEECIVELAWDGYHLHELRYL